jgi:hypothetical protein
MSLLGTLAVEIIDLNSRDAIVAALRKHNVDTVVSAYFLWANEWETEVTLVEAAEAAGVRRFAPTCFAMPNNQYVTIFAHFSP